MGTRSTRFATSQDDSETVEGFRIFELLGRGGFSTVKRATRKHSSNTYALKEVHPKRLSDVNVLLEELNIFKTTGQHAFLLSLEKAFVRPNHICCFVFKALLGGDLRLHLSYRTFLESEVAYYIACLGSALNHLHNRNIIHRDVKPENILLDSRGVPSLTDFGVSYQGSDDSVAICTDRSGTLAYMSPESLSEPSRRHSYQSDFWSLGVLAYELLFQSRPFPKHCPYSFVQFSFHYFQPLWAEIQKSGTVPHHQLDWAALDRCLSPCERCLPLLTLPPEHQLFLLDNGDLSPNMRVPIPLLSRAGQEVSAACASVISGLLDIRFPLRLGSLSSFHEFSDHPWFLFYGYCSSLLPSLAPPFVPDLDLVKVRCAQRLKCSSSSSVPEAKPVERPLSQADLALLHREFIYSCSRDLSTGDKRWQSSTVNSVSEHYRMAGLTID